MPGMNSGVSPIHRIARGCISLLMGVVFPFGRLCRGSWCETQRLERGYILILPGIEGKSFFNVGLAQGLLDAGVPSAIEIHDWTTGWTILALRHLRIRSRHQAQARAIAQKIVDYQHRFPGRPVHLIGHSGGAGVALLALEALPPDCRVERAILLAPAVSPEYDLTEALGRTRLGVVNFYSRFDFLFLGLGTTLFGTIDRRHSVAAGCRGFPISPAIPPEGVGGENARLIQQPFRGGMIRQFHLGGHFGWSNRVFAAETIAPLIQQFE